MRFANRSVALWMLPVVMALLWTVAAPTASAQDADDVRRMVDEAVRRAGEVAEQVQRQLEEAGIPDRLRELRGEAERRLQELQENAPELPDRDNLRDLTEQARRAVEELQRNLPDADQLQEMTRDLPERAREAMERLRQLFERR